LSYATLEDIPSFTSAPRRAVVKGRSSSKRVRRVDDVIMVLQRGVGELLVLRWCVCEIRDERGEKCNVEALGERDRLATRHSPRCEMHAMTITWRRSLFAQLQPVVRDSHGP